MNVSCPPFVFGTPEDLRQRRRADTVGPRVRDGLDGAFQLPVTGKEGESASGILGDPLGDETVSVRGFRQSRLCRHAQGGLKGLNRPGHLLGPPSVRPDSRRSVVLDPPTDDADAAAGGQQVGYGVNPVGKQGVSGHDNRRNPVSLKAFVQLRQPLRVGNLEARPLEGLTDPACFRLPARKNEDMWFHAFFYGRKGVKL